MKFTDLLLHFLTFEALHLDLEAYSKHQAFFWLQNMNLMGVLFFFFFWIIPSAFFLQCLGGHDVRSQPKKSKGAFRVMAQRIWRYVFKNFHKNWVASSFRNVLKDNISSNNRIEWLETPCNQFHGKSACRKPARRHTQLPNRRFSHHCLPCVMLMELLFLRFF